MLIHPIPAEVDDVPTTGSPKAPRPRTEPRAVTDPHLITVTAAQEGVTRSVSTAELLDLPAQRLSAEYLCAKSGPRRHEFEGPSLYDVLCHVAPEAVPVSRRQRACALLGLWGEDGHRAVVAWAEFDPDFVAGTFLLATAVDGASLVERGPQLVSAGDGCGTRFVSGVTALHVQVGVPAA